MAVPRSTVDRNRRLTRTIVTAACAILLLSGCERVNIPPPVSFTLRDGRPIVRLCTSMTVHEVRVEDYVSRADPPGALRWRESGPVDLPAGTEIPLGISSNGMTAEDVADDLLSSDLSVRLVVSDVDSANSRDTRTSDLDTPLGNEQFVEGVWIGGLGQRLEYACEDFTDSR